MKVPSTLGQSTKDLIVLAADRDIETTVKTLFHSRTEALKIREISAEYRTHPHRDPGCYAEGVTFLRPFCKKYRHAILIFDREGCGQESHCREDIESELTQKLAANGWDDRAAVIVLDPEIEVWIWSTSPIVEEILCWKERQPSLRQWLQERNLLIPSHPKPTDPKRALEEITTTTAVERSPALFKKFAERISLSRCTDPAFQKLKNVMHGWFGNHH